MRRSERGFTLAEMLVVVATIGLVAVMVTAIYVQGMHTYGAGQATGLVIADVRFAMDNMATRLRSATPGTINITLGGRQIEFQWLDRPPGSTTSITRTIIYQLDATTNTIRISNLPVNQTPQFQPMASFVQTLQFALVDARTLIITVTTVDHTLVPGGRAGGGLPFTLTTRVTLRN